LAAANAFSSLDSGVQKLILSLAGIVIATGPVVSAFGAIKQFAGTFVSIWANVLSSVKAGITAFKALDTAMKLTVIGGLIAAVGLLAAAYTHFSSQLTDAERAQKSLSEVNRKAAESVAGQKSEVDTLVAAYKSEGATLDQKKAILSELNRISPEYFGGIRVGKGDIEAITAATAKYSAELIKVAKATAYKDRLVEIEKELLNLNKTAQPSIIQSVGNALLSFGNVSGFAAKQAQTAADNIIEQTKALEAERTALSQNLTQLTLADAATGKLTQSTKAYTESVKQATAAKEAAKTPQISTANIAAVPATSVTSTAENPLPAAPALIEAATTQLKLYSEAAAYASEIQEQLNDGVFNFSEGLTGMTEPLLQQGNLLGAVFVSMGNAIAQAAAQGETSFAKLGQAAVAAGAKIIRAYIQQGVSAAVARALGSLPFPANLAAGAAAGGIAAALFTRAVGAIGIKGFARGTGYAPGGLSLVGEQGPELVNLPRGSQVYSNPKTNRMLDSMGGGGMLSGEFTVRGTDLVLVLERAQNKNQRFR
jgi:hypothetical protein